MIILNFISPTQREENRFQKNYSLVKEIIVIFVISLVVIVGFLQLTQIILNNKLDNVTADTKTLKQQTEEEKSVDLGKTVKEFNKLLKNIDGIQAEYTFWSEILIKTASFVPSGVRLSSFTINRVNSNFKITGRANFRDDLLNLKRNLEESDHFIEIQSPISNILLRENINFELSGKIIFDLDTQEI